MKSYVFVFWLQLRSLQVLKITLKKMRLHWALRTVSIGPPDPNFNTFSLIFGKGFWTTTLRYIRVKSPLSLRLHVICLGCIWKSASALGQPILGGPMETHSVFGQLVPLASFSFSPSPHTIILIHLQTTYNTEKLENISIEAFTTKNKNQQKLSFW